MKMVWEFASVAAGALLVATAQPASALTFTLVDYNGSVAGSAAAQGFQKAADYWSSVITNDVNVRLEIGYTGISGNVIGTAFSQKDGASVASVYQRLSTTGNSALDAMAVANLTPLTAAGGLTMMTSGVNISTQVYDADNSANNLQLLSNTASLKALGFSYNPLLVDGRINFNTALNFDFDPTDGITAGAFDFIGVAIHEIGHVLGFTSGVDEYDYFAGDPTFDLNDYAEFSTLDLFRYSADPRSLAHGPGRVLDLSVGAAAYMSVDGGATQLFGDSRFSTGARHGDGWQASHWKDTSGCGLQIGAMDPTFCRATGVTVTAQDLAAMDAIGWNLNFDILGNSGYQITTADIFNGVGSAVPEPQTWAMMLLGFGILGVSLRSRRGLYLRTA
jgi:hypothetical protein